MDKEKLGVISTCGTQSGFSLIKCGPAKRTGSLEKILSSFFGNKI